MNVKRMTAAGATPAAALGMAAFGFAGSAGASTPGCANSNQHYEMQYCGAQVSHQAHPLAWDVAGQHATYNNKIIAWPNSRTDLATDFSEFQDQENTTTWADNSVSVEYAPNGKPSGMVVSEPSSHAGLVLRPANGSAWQQFHVHATGSGNTFTNAATGDVVSVTGSQGSQLSGITAPKPLTGAQEFQLAS
jgi:hypothetical protein